MRNVVWLQIMINHRGSQLVNWCFEPSQLLGIISGLKETFIKRHTVERAIKREIRHKKRIKRNGQARLVYVRHKP